MIYGIFIMPFIGKNNINHVCTENGGVGTNYGSVHQFSFQGNYYKKQKPLRKELLDDYISVFKACATTTVVGSSVLSFYKF
jgi:hypothetical protein